MERGEMTESKLLQLIKKENEHRRLAQVHENKAEYHWNKSNSLFLEILAAVENEKELDSYELANS